jgi:hypothetical protein
VYRVLAAMAFFDEVNDVCKLVTSKSPIAEQFSLRHAIEFLGDALEITFRPAFDPDNDKAGRILVRKFQARWQFSEPHSE